MHANSGTRSDFILDLLEYGKKNIVTTAMPVKGKLLYYVGPTTMMHDYSTSKVTNMPFMINSMEKCSLLFLISRPYEIFPRIIKEGKYVNDEYSIWEYVENKKNPLRFIDVLYAQKTYTMELFIEDYNLETSGVDFRLLNPDEVFITRAEAKTAGFLIDE